MDDDASCHLCRGGESVVGDADTVELAACIKGDGACFGQWLPSELLGGIGETDSEA